MRDGRGQFDERQRTDVERLIARDGDETTGKGKPLSERARQSRRSVESYLQGGVRPRWMERFGDIDGGTARERRLLQDAYVRLGESCGREGTPFAECWRAVAESWPFPAELNELIEQHNAWYPIERDLPFSPRTGEYVRVGGRWYGRPTLGSDWILEQFPAGRSGSPAAAPCRRRPAPVQTHDRAVNAARTASDGMTGVAGGRRCGDLSAAHPQPLAASSSSASSARCTSRSIFG